MSENKQDITQLRQRLAQSTIIVDATRRFTSTLDFDEIRLALFEAASQIVGAQQIVLHLLNEQELQSYVCYPMEGLRIETAVLPPEATAFRIYREVEQVIWHHDDADQSAPPISVEVIDKFDSYLALPLKGANHVVGVIEALNLLEPQNAAQQADLLAEIAGSAGLALYNGMLYQDAQQSRQSAQEYLDMQNVLHEINIELFRIDDLDELYRSAVELAHTRLGFDRVGMFLLNESKDLLLGTYGVDAAGNVCDERGPDYVIDQKETIDAFVLNRTRLIVNEDIDLWYLGEVVGRGWHIGAAMWTEESPIGVIFADNLVTGRPLKPYQSELLFAYAGIVSNLIQRNRFDTIITNRAAEMQAVAEVSTAAATILDIDKLLQEMVDLTKNSFDLYHAHIYLLNKKTETLVLTSGAGTVGQQMVAEGRQIPLQQEQSLVARAARSRQGVVINDVQSEPGFLPHPLLPNTRSEMAVPLITGDRVLGVLDVQSDQLNYFSKEDISTFTTLAAQTAVALQNARLFTESEKRASELAFISRIVTEINTVDVETGLQFMAEELGEILQVPLINVRLIDETGTMLKVVAACHPAESPSPVGTVFPIGKDPINEALQNRQTVIIEDVANSDVPPHIQKRILESGICSVYMIPMVVGRDLIGSVAINIPEGGSVLTPAQLRLVETTIQQAATAVQNARLFTESEERAEELAFVNKVVAEVSASLDIEQSLQIVADELAKVVDLEGIGIALLNDDKTSLTVVAEHYSSEEAASILGYTYPLAGNPVTQKAFSTRNTVLVEDAQNHPLTEPIHAGLRMRGVQTMYVIPMFAGNEIVGTVGFDSKEKDRLMSPQQMRLAETIVYQVATAVQNARQYDEIRRSQESLRQSEAELSEALKIAKLAYWEYDVEKDLFTFNDQFFALFHTTAEEHGGYQLPSAYYAEHFVHPDDLPIVGAEIERALNSTDRHYSQSAEHRILYADGGVGYFSVNINIDRDEQGNILRYYGANQDITERKQVEEVLRHNESELSEALKIAKLAYWEYDVENDLFTFNDQFYALFHTTAEAHGGYQLSSAYYAEHFVHPDDLPMVGGEIERALNSTDRHYHNSLEHRILYADGGVGYISVTITLERDEDGNILRYSGANQDITERKQAEEAMAKRAVELQIIADLSAQTTLIQQPQSLLEAIVQETQRRFHLYHCHVFVLDESGENLQIRACGWEAGSLHEGTHGTAVIPMSAEKSLVAQAAGTRKPVVVNDVYNDPYWLPNELLPNTRSEMAVPMIAGGELIGVLDVQSEEAGRFSEQDKQIHLTLAAQTAVALQNARFLNQSEQAVKELQALSRRLTREGWQEYFTQRKDKLTFGYDQQQKVSVSEVEPDRIAFPKDAHLVTQPLQIQGESIGQLRLEISEQYGDDESELLTAVSERLSAHLENLRLAEASEKDRAAAEKRSQEMAVINNIVTQISTSLDLQHSLQIVVDELVTAVNVDQARVALVQPDKKELLVIAEHYDASRATSAVGMAIPIEGNELTQKVIETRQLIVVEDAQNSPQTAPVHDLFREQGIQTVVLMPLVVNDEVIGTLGMDILDDRPVREEGLKLAETIVFQTATAIQNARLFEQVQATLAETEMLYSYSSQLNTATSLDAVLDSAAAAGFQVGATDAVLLVYDRNTTGNPEYAQVAATAPRNEKQVGERLYLQEQPTRYLWPASGQNTVFVGNVSADARLSPEDKETFAQQGLEAVAIMYLNVGNLRLGQIIIHWDKVQTFTNADERLYGAIAQQASSVVYNRLLFNQTEEALSETAALYQASADLNTAQTFDEVLIALRQHTILGQGTHNVTISFFDRVWDKDDLPEEVHVLAEWGVTDVEDRPTRFKVDAFPGFLDLLDQDELQVHEDVANDKRISEEGRVGFVEYFNTQAIVSAPLIVGSRRLGFINGYYPKPMSFTEEQLRRLNVLSRQAAITIQSIRLYEQTQEALAQTEALYTGSERIVLASTEEDILQSLIQSTELRRLDRASLYMFDRPVEDRVPRDVTVVATWVNEGVPPSVQVGTRFEVARVPFLSGVNPDQSLVMNDIRNDPRVDEQTRQILEGYGMISFVMVPIVVGSQWLGMVSGQSSEPMNMTEVQMRQANSLVGQAAVVMQTTILFRQEQARARREHLLREIATKVRNSTDIDTIMQTAVTEIGRTLGRRSFIKLGNGQNGDAQAGDDQLSQTQTENGAT